MSIEQFNKLPATQHIDVQKIVPVTPISFIMGCLLLLATLLLSKAVSAQTLVINDNINQVSAAPYITLLEDTSHTLTIEQVTTPAYKNQFQAHAAEYLNLGHSESVWWLKLDVERQTSQSWYALIDFVAISRVDAFLAPSNSDKVINLGNMRKDFTFQRLPTVRLPQNEVRFTLYIRIENHGKEVLQLPVQMISADALYEKTAKDYLFYGGILLGLLILIPYNLFLYISLRNPTYLTLVTLLVCVALVLQRTSNVIPWLSPFSNPETFYYPLCFQLVGISGVQFWRQLTDNKKLFPRADKIVQIILVLMIIQIPFLQVLPYPDSWSYTLTAMLIFMMGCLGVLALYKNPQVMFSFSLPFFVFAGSATPAILWGMGFLVEANTPVKIFHIGSLLSALLLSVSLAEHTRQLRLQAERLKTESKAKDSFLTTMSHELRTPMHAVSSVVHLFKSTTLSERQKTYLNKLEISADHMLSLINKILDLGRMDSTEFRLEKQPFELGETLQQVSQLLTEEAKQKRLLLSIENHTALSDKLLIGDSTRLKQILLNLLHNAIKFTDKGSVTLIVETANTHLHENTVSLQFRVTDTGIGVPKEQHTTIFQAFSQADNSTQRKYGGSGLGLAISYKLVNQMGGTLKLDSTPKKGSCFFFSLEFLLHADSTNPVITDSSSPETKTTRGKMTVLLVDDVELNRFLGGEVLKTLGVTVITAASGKTALQTLHSAQYPIDLVLMDVSMPEMDGYETTRQIRAESRFANLPVVALTAHAIAGERERCLAAGMNDYLSKPFELEQLEEKIQQWTTDRIS